MFGFRSKSDAPAGGALGAYRVAQARARELEEHLLAAPTVPPRAGCIYRTRNGSIVCVAVAPSGDHVALVLHGGHGMPWSGECPGERYAISRDGAFCLPDFGAMMRAQSAGPMGFLATSQEGEEWKTKKTVAEPPHFAEQKRRARLMDLVEELCAAEDLLRLERKT